MISCPSVGSELEKLGFNPVGWGWKCILWQNGGREWDGKKNSDGIWDWKSLFWILFLMKYHVVHVCIYTQCTVA